MTIVMEWPCFDQMGQCAGGENLEVVRVGVDSKDSHVIN